MTKEIGEITIDATDQRLLALLREDAMAPTARLGRKLGLSRTTVQTRIERLQKRGIISGFTVRHSEAHERGQIQAQVMITTLIRLADAPVLPFEFHALSRTVHGYLEDIQKQSGAAVDLHMVSDRRQMEPVRGRIIRAMVARLQPHAIRYRGAMVFDRPLSWLG